MSFSLIFLVFIEKNKLNCFITENDNFIFFSIFFINLYLKFLLTFEFITFLLKNSKKIQKWQRTIYKNTRKNGKCGTKVSQGSK